DRRSKEQNSADFAQTLDRLLKVNFPQYKPNSLKIDKAIGSAGQPVRQFHVSLKLEIADRTIPLTRHISTGVSGDGICFEVSPTVKITGNQPTLHCGSKLKQLCEALIDSTWQS